MENEPPIADFSLEQASIQKNADAVVPPTWFKARFLLSLFILNVFQRNSQTCFHKYGIWTPAVH